MDFSDRKNSSKVFEAFYGMLNTIRVSSRRNPEAASKVLRDGEQFEKMVAELQNPKISFSGEECFGRYVDLHESYNNYINSKFGNITTYANDLDKFPALDLIPPKYKSTRQYKEYIKGVLAYLISFLERAKPLTFLDRLFKNLESEFEANWMGTHRGKKRRRTTSVDDVNEEIVVIEAKVEKLCEILKETIEWTRERVKNRQGMSFDELVRDREADNETIAQDIASDNGEEDDDKREKNPLKLPMGWDGKPIPYWLYKLHGLNKEFECEICGNHTYKGRRAFEKHFQGGRHQRGMDCLGIPNSKSFYEITRIDDAKQLWRQIQARQESLVWQPDDFEEFEDAEGNVYSKNTYNDLLRQGYHIACVY